MILVDANLLIYAHARSMPQHAAARDWLDAQLGGRGSVGIPWSSLLAFLRIVTNPRVFDRPETTQEAWRQVRAWIDLENVWVPQPTQLHAEHVERFLVLSGVQGNLVHDAHLAALAVEYGLELCSTDGDFARFPGLRWRNPLNA